MKDYFRSLGMPVTMQELGVAPEEYDSIAELTIAGAGGAIPSYGSKLTKEEIIEIYRLAE